MTSVQIIGHKKPDGYSRKKNIFCCCFGAKRSNSNVSVEADFTEPYEYVVEKLVIKRIPVKRFTTASELKRVKSSSSDKDVVKEVKPIVTFSSYCQVGPMVVNKKQAPLSLLDDTSEDCATRKEATPSPKVLHHEEAEIKNQAAFLLDEGEGNVNSSLDSPREDMTSGRKEQLQRCVRKMNTAQVYKHKTNSPKAIPKRKSAPEHNVLFTKSMSTSKGQSELPQAVKETMDLLATKPPMSSVNRRLITRDPDTGQIKEVFQNMKLEKPVRLEEIYPHKESPEKKRAKWKIIIRHRNDKEKKLEESSSELRTDTDA